MYTQLFCLLLCITIISATSSGIDIGLCDILSPLWGCNPDLWPGLDEASRKQCANKTNIMSWVSWPVRSEDFLFFIGDSENTNPPSSYTPDEYFNVGVLNLNYDMRFRGLFMYAVDSTETKVGEWYIYEESPEIYHMPASSCENSVLHAGAAVKEGVQLFAFKAPAGTGPITFRVLVKEGDANTGAFYLPNLQDITLQEGTPANKNDEWELTEVGQSCRDYCEAKAQYCNTAKLLEIDSEADLANVAEDHPCKFPYLSSCATFGPARGEDDLCYYQDSKSECVAEDRTYETPACQIEAPGKQRLCVCSTDASVDIDFRDGTNAGSFLRLSWTILAAFFCLYNPKKSSVVLITLLVIITLSHSVEGHNWVNTKSRSVIASTHKPFLPKTSNKPHVQISDGQTFQVEWMTGHEGRMTYLILVHKDDEPEVKAHRFSLLDDYLEEALNAGAVNYAHTLDGQRLHRKAEGETGEGYDKQILPGDPQYIERPEEFAPYRASRGKTLFSYNSTHRANDIRVIHKSEKYPWIIAMDKFAHTFGIASEYDVATFSIPDGYPYGEYILQYMWAGYYDAIDISYIENGGQPVEFVYGEDRDDIPTTYTRVDHCYFPQITSNGFYNPAGPVKPILNRDPIACLERCRVKTDCTNVQVIPLRVPEGVRDNFKDMAGMSEIIDLDRYNSTLLQLLDEYSDEDAYVCYDLDARPPSETVGSYVISNDPTNPIFYSTCYIQNDKRRFIGYEDTTQAEIKTPWRFGSKCLSCETYAEIISSDYLVPHWKFADKCVNCDEEPLNPEDFKRPDFKVSMMRNHSRCDGLSSGDEDSYQVPFHKTCPASDNTTRCVIRLLPIDSTTRVTLKTCINMVVANPLCSNVFSKSHGATEDPEDALSDCYCMAKAECCHICSPRRVTNWYTYEIAENSFESDPTCATGTLEIVAGADPNDISGRACCSKECGYGGCREGTDTRQAFGFCSSDQIFRSCNEYGPPCRVE